MEIKFPNEKSLIDSINDREVCLLLGAGFSYGMKNIMGNTILNADKLKEYIQEKLFARWSKEDKAQFHSLDLVISEALSCNLKGELNKLLLDELTVRTEDLDSIYYFLSKPNWYRIYTLNVDNSLDLIFKESALPLSVYKFPNSLAFHDRNASNETQIIYLHGKLPCDAEKELVFSFESYLTQTSKKQNDLYRFFLRDFFTRSFIIIGVSFNDNDFYSYAIDEKDKSGIDFHNSRESYLIDIFESGHKDLKLKRDFNITHLPGTSATDFLNWIKINQKQFSSSNEASVSLSTQFKKINLNGFPKFELSFLRSEFVEEEDVFKKFALDVLKSPKNKITPLHHGHLVKYKFIHELDTGIDIIAIDDSEPDNKVLLRFIPLSEEVKDVNECIKDLNKQLFISIPQQLSIWQNKQVSKYIVCIPFECKQNDLKQANYEKIKEIFSYYAHDLGFPQLNNIEIILIYWNDFVQLLERDVYLYHKWIGKEPKYLRVLSSWSYTNTRDVDLDYRDYLSSNHLPYYSRNNFYYKLSAVQKTNFVTEKSLLSTLKKTSVNGIIIYGEGGIGKSRLMYELGKFSQDKYIVIDVNKNFSEIKDLQEFMDPSGKYILLFDYLEDQKIFIKVVDWIFSNRIHNIKFIANCRKSFYSEIDHLVRYKTELIDISISKTIEKKYKEEISKYILKTIADENLLKQIVNNKNILSFLFQRPSFAVFVKFLHQKNLNINAELKNQIDFNNWILARLKSTLNVSHLNNKEFAREKAYIFKIFSSLQAHDKSATLLKNNFISEISALIDDGWIKEDENGNLNVVHSTITDILLLYYFNKTLNEGLINEFLEFSLKFNSLPSLIRSFERLFDDEEILTSKKEKIQSQLKLFIEKQMDTQLEPDEASPLVSYWLRKGNKPEIVKPLIEKTLKGCSKSTSSLIIGYWLESGDDPQVVKPYIDGCLDSDISIKSGCYIIGYWLAKGDEPTLVKRHLKKYLGSKIDKRNIFYIISNWLQKGDDPAYLNEYILAWLSSEENEQTVGNLITVFIKYGGNIDVIRENAIKWLNDNPTNSLSISIIGFWLSQLPEANNQKEVLFFMPYVETILKHFHSVSVTGSVILNWIIKGGNLKILKHYLRIWLSKFIDTPLSGIVISKWLEHGGFPKEVKDFIVPWLKIFGTTQFASELMFSWLDKGYDPQIIKSFVKPYLNIHSSRFESKYLINTAMTELQPDLVKEAINPWLKENYNKKESLYLAANWVTNGNDLKLVQPYIQNYLYSYIDEERDTNRILENWLLKGGDPEIIKSLVLRYLKRYWHEKNSIFLIRHWINATNSDKEVKTYMSKILIRKKYFRYNPFGQESFFLLKLFPLIKVFLKNKLLTRLNNKVHLIIQYKIQRHLQEKQDPNQIKPHVKKYFTHYEGSISSTIVLRKWLEYAKDFDFAKPYLVNALKRHGEEKVTGSFIIGDGLLSCIDGFNLCHSYALKWLEKFSDTESAFYVLSSYCKAIDNFNLSDDIEYIESYISPCLDKNYKNPNALDPSWKWRQSILLKYSNNWEPKYIEFEKELIDAQPI